MTEFILGSAVPLMVSTVVSVILAGLGLVSFGTCFWITLLIVYVIIIIAGGDIGI